MSKTLVLTAALSLGADLASAQVTGPQRPASAAKPAAEETTKRNADEVAVADCIAMWDSGTHMTKKEWSQTCRRVQTRLQRLETK